MPAIRRKRLRMWLAVIGVSAVLGTVYGLFLAARFEPGDPKAKPLFAIMGALHGMLIGGGISAVEIFALQLPALRRFNELPFFAVVTLKTLAYGLLVLAVHSGAPGPQLLGLLLDRELRAGGMIAPATGLTVGLSLFTTLLFVLLMQSAQMLGFRTARDLFLGRYRRPRAERRFFLFVDVAGSTAIAERLGPLEAHRFLSAVFAALAEPVAACRGEIYQYVGDEIVVTWSEREGAPEARPLRCFFLMEHSVAGLAQEFMKRFSVQPRLRAALHFGEVIAGEVGVWRRAIVFHGDVMNTASRLENATRELGERFIASAEALRALGPPPGVASRDLGALALRGRSEPIRAYAIRHLQGAPA